MVPLEAPYPDIYTDNFIFFLQSLYEIIWMNVHYFPNTPRTLSSLIVLVALVTWFLHHYLTTIFYINMFN